MGIVLYKGHPSYELMRNIQMGIFTMIELNWLKRPKRIIEELDYKVTVKLNFPHKGSSQTQSHPFHDFEFKDYCPMVFRWIREQFLIDPLEYKNSICSEDCLSMLGTPGKSGSIFFFSHDMKYILKTVTKKESKFLQKLLKPYHEHLKQHQHTLITRFYGLYRIKIENKKNIRFVVMNNVFMTSLKIDERYDLKGSTVGRMATEEEKRKEVVILKDLDLHKHIYFDSSVTKLLLQQIEMDTNFLKLNNIMDYSMLLGVHRVVNSDLFVTKQRINTFENWFQKDVGGTIDINKKNVYFLGIIDILQEFDTRKQFERVFKTIQFKKEQISCAEPKFYATRFVEFMRKIFIVTEETSVRTLFASLE